MIAAGTNGAGAFAAHLAALARRRAEAWGESRLRQRRADPGRWRLARLLWPLFGKEP